MFFKKSREMMSEIFPTVMVPIYAEMPAHTKKRWTFGTFTKKGLINGYYNSFIIFLKEVQ